MGYASVLACLLLIGLGVITAILFRTARYWVFCFAVGALLFAADVVVNTWQPQPIGANQLTSRAK